jgi:hypothetical protein
MVGRSYYFPAITKRNRQAVFFVVPIRGSCVDLDGRLVVQAPDSQRTRYQAAAPDV